MSDTLGDIKDIAIIAVIGVAGVAIYYLITVVMPQVNKNINQSVGSYGNTAIQQQAQQVASGNTTPTIPTFFSNTTNLSDILNYGITSITDNLYLDIPTNVIQGSNEVVYAYSANQKDNIVLGIANSNGWGVWQGTGTGSVKSPSLDTLHLTVGSTYKVTAIDTSSNLSRQGSFVYQSSSSNSIGNIFNQIEQGAKNLFNTL